MVKRGSDEAVPQGTEPRDVGGRVIAIAVRRGRLGAVEDARVFLRNTREEVRVRWSLLRLRHRQGDCLSVCPSDQRVTLHGIWLTERFRARSSAG